MGTDATRIADVYQSDASDHPLFARLTQSPKLDSETVGRLIVFAWAAQNGRSDLPDRDALSREFLKNRESLPDEGKELVHAETRAIGEPSIAEYSDYMAAAQDAGLIKRYNPAYIRCYVEVDQLEAKDRLNEYRRTYSGLVEWVEARMQKLSQR